MGGGPTGFFAKRIERKLALLLSLVAVVSVLVLGLLAVRTITVTREQNVAELTWQLAAQSVDRVRRYVDDKVEVFRLVVADPGVTAIGYDQQLAVLRGHLAADPALLEISFLTQDSGFETARVVRGQENSPHRELGLRDPSVVAARSGQSYLGPVEFTSKGPTMVLAAPVFAQGGAIIGLLRGVASLAPLQTLLAQANLGTSGYLYVVTADGRVLAASSNVSGRLAPGATDAAASTFVVDLASGRVAQSQVTPRTYRSPMNGSEVFVAGRTLAQTGWSVIAEWPRAEAMAVVPQVVGNLALGALALLLVLVAASIYLARSFARPLLGLTAAATEIGQGRFQVALPTAGADEVGELARSFQHMTEGLKELERLKDEFVFIAAHELRTPVTAIRGYAEMLKDASATFPDQAKEFVARLEESGARLANLVNDLLEVARSQAGRMKIETTPQDLLALIRGTLAELTLLAQEKQQVLTLAPPLSVPRVLADRAKLQEVLVNLVGNAVKYTPQGGQVTVTVEVTEGAVVTHVTDTGIGIAPEDQAKLFQRFFRVESDETRNIQGTGLGLFIVREIVEHMNGQIWVESEKGKGSTFSFSLPVVPSA